MCTSHISTPWFSPLMTSGESFISTEKFCFYTFNPYFSSNYPVSLFSEGGSFCQSTFSKSREICYSKNKIAIIPRDLWYFKTKSVTNLRAWQFFKSKILTNPCVCQYFKNEIVYFPRDLWYFSFGIAIIPRDLWYSKNKILTNPRACRYFKNESVTNLFDVYLEIKINPSAILENPSFFYTKPQNILAKDCIYIASKQQNITYYLSFSEN